MRSLIPLILLLALGGCTFQEPLDIPIASGTLPTLGIAFPPVADAEQRALTLEALSDLCTRQVRLAQPWGLREPERDRFVWGPLDRRFQSLESAGVEVLLTLELKGLPDWLDSLSQGEQEAEFREYVRALLDRAGPSLTAIQFGNEWTWELDRYVGGDVDAFVTFATVLAEEVARRPVTGRPEVVLGSFSIGGLHGLAFLQGRIDNVYFGDTPLYADQQLEEARANGDAALERYRTIVGSIPYSAIDLHFYDDVWNWPTYREAIDQLLVESGRDPQRIQFVASEFGGPHPTLEPAGEAFAARRIRQYAEVLGQIGIERAYVFKLVEEPGADIAHPNSFLIDAELRRTASFTSFQDLSCG
ncbi:MAG: hypothetical protein AAGK21_10810 [Bacteroidota bacterium]